MDFNPSNDAGLEPLNFKVSNGTDEEFEIGTSGCISQFLWGNSNIAEADAKFEAASHLSFFLEYFASQHQRRASLQSDATYSSLLEAPPLIPVSVGPEHKADVPEWNSRGSKSFVDNLDVSGHQVELAPLSDFSLVVDDGDEEKLRGTCVILMPDYETSTNYCSERCGTRNDFKCIDRGSIDCVRHVTEARVNLLENLGGMIFEELGFCEMGEEVSKSGLKRKSKLSLKLSVLTLHRWGRISGTISHWFDPHNFDSDNDEWQISEHEAGAAEEDEGDEGDVDDISVQHVKNSFGDAGGNTDLHIF
ncbi:hypothetical protein Pint_19096 [Pistacia integerrima]|uniref:Uncharacterized protein n=1 Tax=Pistacia integerrima TaxID=434235 RepID=A0ACC0YVS5_9ROSI|nr:hypothetical protein Pint_19096 [Pistacia integerrima]